MALIHEQPAETLEAVLLLRARLIAEGWADEARLGPARYSGLKAEGVLRDLLGNDGSLGAELARRVLLGRLPSLQ